jgi:hypothetical protein
MSLLEQSDWAGTLVAERRWDVMRYARAFPDFGHEMARAVG